MVKRNLPDCVVQADCLFLPNLKIPVAPSLWGQFGTYLQSLGYAVLSPPTADHRRHYEPTHCPDRCRQCKTTVKYEHRD